MAILITSPGLVTTGTEGADEILFGSSVAANGSVVNALAGNDTIKLTAARSTGVSAVGRPNPAMAWVELTSSVTSGLLLFLSQAAKSTEELVVTQSPLRRLAFWHRR